ncbi:MAG TPA: DUF2914 domain-containing protein [Kofleriaceae bacterium]|nr:DUF2914 domain-containing protein [Kofleriaceae bacterium]
MLIGGAALADDAKKPPATQPSPPPPAAAPSTGAAAAEVHAGTGYEKHAIVGEAESFPSGTKVFVVSLVTGANGTQVKHVWKKDGAELWSATLNVGSNKWTTSSRRVLSKAGSYEVSVVGADGGELGKVAFTIQ